MLDGFRYTPIHFFLKKETELLTFMLLLKDITDKKNTEEAYLATQRTLLTLMSNLPVWFTDVYLTINGQ
jgi:hypothetical protein